MNWVPLTSLGESTLRELAAALETGRLRLASPLAVLAAIVGAQAAEARTVFDALREGGFDEPKLALLIRALLADRGGAADKPHDPTLVISGPEVTGVPMADTEAVVQGLFQEAKEEVLIVGYAFHDGKRLFARLADKMSQTPALRVAFYLDIPRRPGDTSLESEILRRFAHDFRRRHWPWEPRPELYYDPRALSVDRTQRASLHAKCIIVDRKVAFITSANFTPAAQQRNIEVGVVARDGALASRLADYFLCIAQTGTLLPFSLN